MRSLMQRIFVLKLPIAFLIFAQSLAPAWGQVPAHAQGLKEELVTVDVSDNVKQAGVLSVKSGTANHTRLAVLLPGYPSVVRPVVENGVMINSKLNGNFLIRARRQLADETIATLIVDCQSNSGDYCSSSYQASKERQIHVQKLIDEARRQIPTLQQVWLVGTSMGTISSSFMPVHSPAAYSGAIHTASITEPFARNSYRELSGFDYSQSKVPQFFVHHKNDPCHLTTWSGAKSISEKYGVKLITVTGGSGFQGAACDAFTEHGFRGKEREVMAAIATIIKTGEPAGLAVD
jgi:hypothetical protein